MSLDAARFEAVHAYNWAGDMEFQAGLRAIVSAASGPEHAEELSLQAKCFYYTRKSGIPIDSNSFKLWLAEQQNPSQSESDLMPKAPDSSIDASRPVEEQSTDANNSKVNTENRSINDPLLAVEPEKSDTAAGKVDAPYPTSFAHIVELITTGQPIPGIREIPNTLNSAPPSEATKPKRRKPWEVAAEAACADENRG